VTGSFLARSDILRFEPPANNTSVLPLVGDKSFKKMSDADFDLITAVHLKGAYACTKACWPIFRGQKVSHPFSYPFPRPRRLILIIKLPLLVRPNHQHRLRSRVVRKPWTGKLRGCQDGSGCVYTNARKGRCKVQH
jgi:NAD(P)-dependent dehydrogenase (short-subunit alcohol dehydrogenase family)